MLVHLKGAVEQHRFKPTTQRLLPLFEAIANSLQSILLANQTAGKIEVIFERDVRQTALKLPETNIDPIKDIHVTDNGEGFQQLNYAAFKELYHPIKQEKFGCKGIGRLVWFKTFETVKIRSAYKKNGQIVYREFQQTINDDLPVGGEERPITENQKIETKVSLLNLRPEYKSYLKLKLATIAQEVEQHFFPHLVLFENCPVIHLKDGKDSFTIDGKNFPSSQVEPFQIGEEQFEIRHIKTTQTEDKKHKIYYCADSRAVRTEKLLDFTERKIEDEGEGFFYSGYITSKFLDKKVDSVRSSFALDTEKQADRCDGEIGWTDIQIAANAKAKEYLSSYIQHLNKQKEDTIEEVITGEMPYLAYLREKNGADIGKISVDAPKDEIRKQLTLIHAQNKLHEAHNFRAFISRIETTDKIEDYAVFDKQYREEIQKLSEVNKADLASYILYRKQILEVFDKLISKAGDEDFEYEAGVHSLIFPRFMDSDNADVAYSEHNLWVIDDRWSCYDYAASDLAFNQHKALIGVDSKKEPDVALYNVGFIEDMDNQRHNNVVLLEFKRPGKENFGKDSPFEQVLQYIEQLKTGKMRDYKSREILLADSASFYAYIICDTNNDYIRKLEARSELKRTPDGLGLFKIHEKYNAYIEFLPFRKLLSDAKLRNNIFFKKLIGSEK